MRSRPVLTIGAAALCAALVGALPAAAVPGGASGQYATWATTGASGAWRAAGDVDAAGFPAVALASTSSTLGVPSGASAFLSADTPFGARFGTSRGLPYLSAETAPGRVPSTTTITFAHPTPAAGWGFALGDVDADRVAITATDAAGQALTGADLAAALGWQSAFNYCAVGSPKPSSCTGSGPFTDEPVWDPATATLTGSGTNTLGAAGWFAPSVALGSLTFTFSMQSGTPNYQIWLAALSVPVTGTVEGVDVDTPAPTVELREPDGTPVEDTAGDPVVATVTDSGDLTLPAVTDGEYELHLDPADGTRSTGTRTVPITVDTSAGPVTLPAGTFGIEAAVAASPSSPGPSETSGSASAAPTAQPTGPLAATGADETPTLVLGLLLVTSGGALVLAGRRHARPAHR